MDTFFKLEMIAKDMNILLNVTSKELKYNAYSTEVTTNINLLISALVELNTGMEPILLHNPENRLTESMNELAKYFEDIISCYELNQINLIEDIFLNSLTLKFRKFYKDLSTYFCNITAVKKAIVTGVNDLSINIDQLIDTNKCKIVAFISDNNELQGTYIKDIPVFARNEIPFINYDYLIISDYFTCNLEEKVIININDYKKQYYDYEVFRAYASYFNCKNPLDGFITGLSYAEVGIDTSHLPYNVLNVAVSSQDLFYDYQWAKMILTNHEIGSNVKFAIIGMSYYSFQYDLSKSSLKNKVHNYYPFFKTFRKHPSSEEVIENYIKFQQVASEIFVKEYNTILYNLFKDNSESWWDDMVSKAMDKDAIERDKWIVERDCCKDYPETVQENIRILREYISLLKSKEIIPIIVTCPTSKHYYSKFSLRIKEEYMELMNIIKNEFDIQVFDYFESNAFSDEDFYHVSHLNKNGAKKFTMLLNDRLKNIKLGKFK